MVICLERGGDLHMAQLMPLPLTVSCFSKIRIGFTFVVPAHRVVPDKGSLNGCVCVCVCAATACYIIIGSLLLNLSRQLGVFIASNVQYIANSNSGSHWVRIKEGSHRAELN